MTKTFTTRFKCAQCGQEIDDEFNLASDRGEFTAAVVAAMITKLVKGQEFHVGIAYLIAVFEK